MTQEGFNWENRRRAIFNTLKYCAWMAPAVLVAGFWLPEQVTITAILALAGLVSSTLGYYVAGAAWEHRAIAKGGG